MLQKKCHKKCCRKNIAEKIRQKKCWLKNVAAKML
jgi:hypothetical protein